MTSDPNADLRSLGARSQGAFDARVRPISSGTFADRPAANMIRPWSMYYATDIQTLHYSDGTNWESVVSEWQDYTPAWTVSSGTAPSIGNGNIAGRYMTIGRLCVVQFSFLAGSTTTFGSGGTWRFSTPIAASSGRVAYVTGTGEVVDAGVRAYPAAVSLVTVLTWEFKLFRVFGSNYAYIDGVWNTNPFTWGNGDWAQAFFAYEI